MSQSKPTGKPQVSEKDDIQEQDDELTGETGTGSGSHSQVAPHIAESTIDEDLGEDDDFPPPGNLDPRPKPR